MDEFGMEIRLPHARRPNWGIGQAYINDILSTNDPDRAEIILQNYAEKGWPQDPLNEMNPITIRKDFEDVESIINNILDGGSFYGGMIKINGEQLIALKPNTSADLLVESVWRSGVLAAAGFRI